MRKHALAVEACVAACGEAETNRLGLDGGERAAMINLYSTTALLHDFDYERHPSAEEHPFVGVRELERLGWPVELRTAILGHAQYSGVPRVTHLDKALFGCDELAGFLTACALVKPTKAIADVEVASVRKKMKDKAFARGVNREDVIQGAAELGVELDAHIGFCIEAMRRRAEELGL
ncbi:MAG: HAD family hydrolase [Terracidiphilus sp.]